MEKQTNVTTSVQVSFSIDNWYSGKYLLLVPPIYAKLTYPGEDPTFKIVDGVAMNSMGGSYSASVKVNNYGKQVGYNRLSQSLLMISDSEEYVFELVKDGDQITYRSPENGVVEALHVLYDDIVGTVVLRVGAPPLSVNKNITAPVSENDVFSIPEDGWYSTGLSITSTSKSKTIPDTEMFSLLQNVNLYVSGPFYQLISGELVKVEEQNSNAFGIWGGYFALSGDKNKLYPDGISELVINDGLSEGKAIVEFNHNAGEKTVTITVKSHTSKVCDIRDLGEVGYGQFPNTIRFGL